MIIIFLYDCRTEDRADYRSMLSRHNDHAESRTEGRAEDRSMLRMMVMQMIVQKVV